MKIIPAIDILGGKCVRLCQGRFEDSTEYDNDPVQMAMRLQSAGLRFLHLVDLDAARYQQLVNIEVVSDICRSTNLQVDYGGGITTPEQAELVLQEGVKAINIGSLAVTNPRGFKKILQVCGPERVILSMDVRNNRVAINGWQVDSGIPLFGFLEICRKFGVTQVCCTDIERDGMLQGPAFNTYKAIKKAFPEITLTASGGISNVEDLQYLQEIGVDAAVVGKAIYEGRIKLEELVC